MNRPPPPRNVAEAKTRLRELSRRTTADVVAWVREHPHEALGLGICFGVLLGSSRRGRRILVGFLSWMIPQHWPQPWQEWLSKLRRNPQN